MKFHHIGLIVHDLNEGKRTIDSITSEVVWSDVIYESGIGVQLMFGVEGGNIRYEIISPLGNNSPILSHLSKKENMFHHVAYEAENFPGSLNELRKRKFLPIGEPVSSVAFNGKRVAFFLTPIRTIIEVIET